MAHLVVGATVYIPDGGINEERALRFLEQQKLIELKKDQANSPKVKALAEALHSPEVKAYIKKTYHGEVVPVF